MEMENLWQFPAVFALAFAFFSYGASTKGMPRTWRTRLEIAGAALAVVLVFAFLSGGEGCSSAHNERDPAEWSAR